MSLKVTSKFVLSLLIVLSVFWVINTLMQQSNPNKGMDSLQHLEFKRIDEHSQGYWKYVLEKDHETVSFQTALEMLQLPNTTLIDMLHDVLTSHTEAIFWECRPVNGKIMDSVPFEFVIIDSKELITRKVSMKSFQAQMEINHAISESAIGFHNLGRDALLVIPTPPVSGPNTQYMTHLASFLRGSNTEHQGKLWNLMAEKVLEELKTTPDRWHWLSTSGLGVSWLHIRLDEAPKYYNYQPYKTPFVRKTILGYQDCLTC